MAVTIEKDTIIGEVLDIAPQSAPLFLAIGMHCLGIPLPGVRLWRRLAWSTASTATPSWPS